MLYAIFFYYSNYFIITLLTIIRYLSGFAAKDDYTHYFIVHYTYHSFSINYFNYFNNFTIIPIISKEYYTYYSKMGPFK